MSEETLPQKFEPIVDIEQLKPEQLEQAKKIAGNIDLEDTQGVLQYGISAQTDISNFSDSILQSIRTKDTGDVGEILTDLMVKVKAVDVNGLDGGGIFGRLVNSVKKFIARYEKMSVHIERIVTELEKQQMILLKDITLLDNMYEKNYEYLGQIDTYISAGQMKLEEIYSEILPGMQKEAQESDDPVTAQKLQNFNQAVVRFEKKLHDLKLSRMISIQTGPQLKLIQSNDQTLVEKIQGSILTTIPLWKNQLVIAVSLMRQKKALKMQKEVADTTNELLRQNSAMLKQSSIDIAKESERGIVDMETLKQVNNDLISTIDETLQIQKEGREKRKIAEKDLQQLETDLKQRLRTIQTQ